MNGNTACLLTMAVILAIVVAVGGWSMYEARTFAAAARGSANIAEAAALICTKRVLDEPAPKGKAQR